MIRAFNPINVSFTATSNNDDSIELDANLSWHLLFCNSYITISLFLSLNWAHSLKFYIWLYLVDMDSFSICIAAKFSPTLLPHGYTDAVCLYAEAVDLLIS